MILGQVVFLIYNTFIKLAYKHIELIGNNY